MKNGQLYSNLLAGIGQMSSSLSVLHQRSGSHIVIPGLPAKQSLANFILRQVEMFSNIG